MTIAGIRKRSAPSVIREFVTRRLKLYSKKLGLGRTSSRMDSAEPAGIRGDKQEDRTEICGVFFIAFGERYVEEAVYCAASVRRCTSLKIAICCDAITGDQRTVFDHIDIVEPGHIRAKVDLLDQTPFERTLYLDSDTEIVEDVGSLFDILDKYDIAMTHDYARKRHKWCQLIPEYNDIPDGFSEFGGGVILYRRSRVQDFIGLWRHYFYKYFQQTSGWDQASLRVAAWKTSNTIYVLPPEYNVRSDKIRAKTDMLPEREGGKHPLRSRILHWHGLNDPDDRTKAFKH